MDSQTYIQRQINNGDAFQDSWSTVSNLYSKKLYHQLIIFIEELLKNPDFFQQCVLKELYDVLISTFENKISLLHFARVAITISKQILEKDGAENAIQFLKKISSKVTNTNKEAAVLLLTEIGLIYLNNCNNMVNARQIREQADSLLNEIDGVSSAHAPFFKLSSAYFCISKNYSCFYREALKYLGCLNEKEFKSLPQNELEDWATKLCVSALLGRDIYNFGELLMHDIINYISEENKYLLELVQNFNEGSLIKIDQMKDKIMKQPDLANDLDFLHEKIMLMSLVETIFQRPVSQRIVRIEEVALATRVDIGEVELVIMKAMSKGLIKGQIDEVEKTLSVTWVQPRVLNHNQMGIAQHNVACWASSVDNMMRLIQENASELSGF